MKTILHITSGDCAAEALEQSGLPGEIMAWHDILYEGPREPGWPGEEILEARASFLEQATSGGMSKKKVLQALREQYQKLATAPDYERLVLWFDACLFDQSMLAHLLALLHARKISQVELLCIDAFPGIEPFDGLGQLKPWQLASLYGQRRRVTEAQFQLAEKADRAFACQDIPLLTELSRCSAAPLPWLPAAAARWLREQPDPVTGLGCLEQLVLRALAEGKKKPGEIFSAVAASDTHPQYWGDTTLWAKINGLADRHPPLVQIDGPEQRLPQWTTHLDLNQFIIKNCSTP